MTESTIFLQLKFLRSFSFIFSCGVITLLALCTPQYDDISHFFACIIYKTNLLIITTYKISSGRFGNLRIDKPLMSLRSKCDLLTFYDTVNIIQQSR